MKKIFIMFLAIASIAVVFTSCKKKANNPGGDDKAWFEPENKQRSLLLNYTAVWCEWCGVWGHPTFNQAELTLGDAALPICVQVAQSELAAFQYKPGNDTPYYARHTSELQSRLKDVTVPSYPTLCVNNKSGYAGGTQTTMVTDAQAFNGIPPEANVNFGIEKTPGGFKAKTTVKFFKAASGDYFLTLLITENNIIHRQNVGGTYITPYNHHNIPRAFPVTNDKEGPGALFGLNKTFGKAIISGSIPEGKFINTELTFIADNKSTLVPSAWNIFTWNMNNTANLYVNAIIWKLDAGTGKYVFVNGIRKAL